MFANCQAVTSATLRYMVAFCIQNIYYALGYQVITDTWAVQQSFY